MNVLVVYASAMGSTEKIAERIAETLRHEGAQVTLCPADGVGEDVLARDVDVYVIGSAVHGGHWLPAATAVAERLVKGPSGRPVWLFSSGPVGERYVNLRQPEPKEVSQLRRLLPVREHVVFAGAFDRDSPGVARLGAMERLAARWIPEGDFRDWPRIEAWALQIARRSTPLGPPASA